MTQKFNIQPLDGPLPIRFGMSEERVYGLLGQPHSKGVNQRRESRWDYGEFTVTFGADGEGVVEVAFFPEAELMLFNIDLFADPAAFTKVLSTVQDVYEDYGFIVIPSLGLTFTGFHDDNEEDKAITVFTSGRWDDRKSKFQRFK